MDSIQGMIRNMIIISMAVLMLPLALNGIDEIDGSDEWAYHSSAEVGILLQQWSSGNEEIAFLTTAQDLFGIREIEGGRTIPILFLGDMDDGSRPVLMLIGGHHGDEPDSVETVLGFSFYILEGYREKDQRIISIIENLNLIIVPVVNPYGLDTGSRFDENGEDPNRDYPFSPEVVTINSDGTPLTTAGAETVHELARRYPADIALSFHTGSKGIYTPWGADQVGNLTPDHRMFHDLGRVLSKASGWDLEHGPANDYGSLGYLRGAFDDHLYGSMFYSSRLDSIDNILPWSIATATIEMISRKGQYVPGLGSIEGVDDIGGPEDGTIPMGIRICLAACDLAAPTMETTWNGSGPQKFTVNGCGSEPELSANQMIEDMGVDVEVELIDEHEYLPSYTYRVDWKKVDQGSNSSYEVEFLMDRSWTEPTDKGDPPISPVSLISASRIGDLGKMTWSRTIAGTKKEGGQSHTGGDLRITSIEPREQEIGLPVSIGLEMEEVIETIVNISVRIEVDGSETVTWIDDTSSISPVLQLEASTPIIEGLGYITATLVTENFTLVDHDVIELYPKVYIASIIREPNHEPPLNDHFRVIFGVDGGKDETTFFYGLTKDRFGPWTGADWELGPIGVVSNEFGPHQVNLDIDHLGGRYYLRVCHHPGGIEDLMEMELSSSLVVSDINPVATEGEISFGPMIMRIDRNGYEEIDHRSQDLDTGFDILDRNGITIGQGQFFWKEALRLTPSEIGILTDGADSLSLSSTQVSGGWFGSWPLSDGTEPAAIRINISGSYYLDQGSGSVQVEIIDEMEITMEKGDPEKDNGFPYWLMVFFILSAGAVLLISLLRKDAHTLIDKDEEEKDGRIDPGRRMDMKKPTKGSPDIRRSRPPPWGSLK